LIFGTFGGTLASLGYVRVYVIPSVIQDAIAVAQPPEQPVTFVAFAFAIAAVGGSAVGLGSSLGAVLLRGISTILRSPQRGAPFLVALGAALGAAPGAVLIASPALALSPVVAIGVVGIAAGVVLGGYDFIIERPSSR
jgi:hypothetical protein